MMKFIKFIIFLVLSSLIFLFTTTLNLKVYFSTADFTKKFLEESKAYSAIAIGLRDNLISNIESENKDIALKFASDAIDETTVKQFLDDVIDQFFALTKLPKEQRKIVIPYSMIGQKINTLAGTAQFDIMSDPQAKQYLSDKEIDMSSNAFVSAFANLGKMLLIYGGLIILFTILMLLGGTWQQKIRWLSFSFLIPAIVSVFEVLFFYLAGNTDFFQKLSRSFGLRDDRFVIAGGKIIAIFWTYQKAFYITTTIILFVVAIILFIISLQRKSEIEKMELTKKPASPPSPSLPPVTK